MKYLTVPRVLGRHAAVPLLVAVGDAIVSFGGYLVGNNRLGFTRRSIWAITVDFLEVWDVGSGMVKGAVFGFSWPTMGCYHGMNSGRGARGWEGRPTKAVVSSSGVLNLGEY